MISWVRYYFLLIIYIFLLLEYRYYYYSIFNFIISLYWLCILVIFVKYIFEESRYKRKNIKIGI